MSYSALIYIFKSSVSLLAPCIFRSLWLATNPFSFAVYPISCLPFSPSQGSFPLDHFLECQEHVDLYKACLSSHNNESAHCHHLAKNYLQCRMDKGLMMKEDLNDLGFAKRTLKLN